MRRRSFVITALLLSAGVALAAAWVWKEQGEAKEVRGSPTVEFVTEAEPGLRKRPKRVITRIPWTTYGYDLARTHYAPEFEHRPPYRRLWTVRTRHYIEFPPSVAYGRVYIQQLKGRFFAVAAGTGRIIWKKRLNQCAAASPTVGRKVVYQAYVPTPCTYGDRSGRGFILAMDAISGKELWKFPVASESTPLLVGNTLYFGAWNHRLYALNVRTRKVRWTFEADDELNTAPAYASGTVFIASDGGTLYAVNAKTGTLNWQARSFSRLGRGREYFYATPTVAYGRVFIGNTDGTVYAFGERSGKLLWANHVGTYVYTAAAVWDRKVYVGTYDGKFLALDAATGDVVWRFDAPGSIHGAPTVLAGLVYFSTCGTCGQNGSRYAKRGPRRTYALDARTGRPVWMFRDGLYSPIVADRWRVYLVGRTRVYGLISEEAVRKHAERTANKRATGRRAGRRDRSASAR